MQKKLAILVLGALVVLTTTFQCMIGPRILNYLVVGLICISPFSLLFKKCRTAIPHIDFPLGIFLLLMWFSALIINPHTIRWSTLLYTTGFCVMFAMLARLIKGANLSANTFSLFLRSMIYCYFVVMVIQQIAVALDWSVVPNKIHHYANAFKLNSLASEPSHTAFTVGLFMIFHALIERHQHPGQTLMENIKENKLLWIAIGWTMVSTQTASACVMFPLGLLPWLRKEDFIPTLSAIAGLILIICFSLAVDNNPQHARVLRAAEAVLSLDEEKIVNADLSASERIVPAVRCFKALDIRDKGFWIGHGVDADVTDFGPSPLDYKTEAYLFHIWYNYGLLCYFPLLWLMMSICFIPGNFTTTVISGAQFFMAAYVTSTPLWTIMALMLIYRICTKQNSEVLTSYPFLPEQKKSRRILPRLVWE